MWLSNFRKTCLAIFLLFTSLFMLVVPLPIWMHERFFNDEWPYTLYTSFFPVVIFGVMASGVFYAYLSDAFRRKHVSMLGYMLVMLSVYGLTIVHLPQFVFLLSLLYGIGFGLACSMLVTLSVDMNISENRTKGNLVFLNYTFSGVLAGAILGSIYNGSLHELLFTSLTISFAGFIVVYLMRVSFRAPMDVSLFSLDRFLLLRTFPLMLNLLCVSLVLGLFLSYSCFTANVSFGDTFLYLFIVTVSFLLTLPFSNLIAKGSLFSRTIVGLTLLCISTACLYFTIEIPTIDIVSALSLGIGLGVLFPSFLQLFIALTAHCQRATANMSFLLALLSGIAAGRCLFSYLVEKNPTRDTLFSYLFPISLFSLLFFLCCSYPYFKKKKVRR